MGRSFGADENINGGCHWSRALNLRHGEERPIYINKNHVCFSLIGHQLKRSIIVLLCLPLGKTLLTHFLRTVCKQVHENIMAFGGGLDSVFNFEK